MEQLQIKKQITGTGFYLDEIEFLIFLIWLEKHNKVMMSDTTPVDVREFYAKCYRDGKIKDFIQQMFLRIRKTVLLLEIVLHTF